MKYSTYIKEQEDPSINISMWDGSNQVKNLGKVAEKMENEHQFSPMSLLEEEGLDDIEGGYNGKNMNLAVFYSDKKTVTKIMNDFVRRYNKFSKETAKRYNAGGDWDDVMDGPVDPMLVTHLFMNKVKPGKAKATKWNWSFS